MKKPNWINTHVRYEYYGGVPRVTIPDNTKTAVQTPDLVNPHLNASYAEIARMFSGLQNQATTNNSYILELDSKISPREIMAPKKMRSMDEL